VDRLLKRLAIVLALVGAVGVGVLAGPRWLAWLTSAPADTAQATNTPQAGFAWPNEQVNLSPQAQRNLRLTSCPLESVTYWRTIQIPGTVVDRPGISDRGVVAPVTAVVTSIDHFAGETVATGEALFALRLVSESFQASQTELFKATKEREIVQEELARLGPIVQSGAVPGTKIIDLRNQLRRLAVTIQAHRQDLQVRGLTLEQIDSVATGSLVSEVTVAVPVGWSSGGPDVSNGSSVLEVQQVHVEIGQHVQAGERLATLSQHESLFIEGRAFRQELPLLQRAAEEAWSIQVQLLESTDYDWQLPIPTVSIHHISSAVNDDNRTISFFLPLENQSRSYERDGRQLFLWRFRPGERVQLRRPRGAACGRLRACLQRRSYRKAQSFLSSGTMAIIFDRKTGSRPAPDAERSGRRQRRQRSAGHLCGTVGCRSDQSCVEIPERFDALWGACARRRFRSHEPLRNRHARYPHSFFSPSSTVYSGLEYRRDDLRRLSLDHDADRRIP
jgi:membrane fusion protein, heavy metal efflux system